MMQVHHQYPISYTSDIALGQKPYFVLPFPALSPSGYLLHIFYTIPHKSWKLEQVQFCPFPGSVLVFSVFLYHPLI